MSSYFVYMLRCSDDSIYTGIAADLKRRLREHMEGSAKCAKYTRSHPPERLEAAWECRSKGDALRLEYRIKQLSRRQKLLLIKENDLSFCEKPELYKRTDTAEYDIFAK